MKSKDLNKLSTLEFDRNMGDLKQVYINLRNVLLANLYTLDKMDKFTLKELYDTQNTNEH